MLFHFWQPFCTNICFYDWQATIWSRDPVLQRAYYGTLFVIPANWPLNDFKLLYGLSATHCTMTLRSRYYHWLFHSDADRPGTRSASPRRFGKKRDMDADSSFESDAKPDRTFQRPRHMLGKKRNANEDADADASFEAWEAATECIVIILFTGRVLSRKRLTNC